MSAPLTFWIKSSHDYSEWPYGATPCYVVDSANPDGFDSVMRARAGEGTTAYVGPGVFLTCGMCGSEFAQGDAPGWRMQSGARLIGSGATTLKLAKCNAAHGAVVVGSSLACGGVVSTARDMVVRDIDIDGNASALCPTDLTAPWLIQAVQLVGVGGCRIERVNVRNVCGMGVNGGSPHDENFILCINSPDGVASVGNAIRSCTVRDFYNPSGNGACSAISINCWKGGTISGVIEDCHVELNGARGWGFGAEFAYNCSNALDLIIKRCSSRGAQRAFNNDTWPNERLHILECHFDVPAGCSLGIFLKKTNRDCYFAENTILLRGADACAVQIERDGEGKVGFLGNRIVAVGAWKGRAISFNCQSNMNPNLVPLNVTMKDNSVEFAPNARIDTLVTPAVGTQTGNLVNGQDSQWPVEQPNVIA